MSSRQLLLNKAGMDAMNGKWRSCADHYRRAYEAGGTSVSDRRSPLGYCCISGYTSIFRDERNCVPPNASDMKFLQRIGNDESVAPAVRTQALFTRGLMLWSQADREGAARNYRKAIGVGEAASSAQRAHCELMPDASSGSYKMKAMGEILDENLIQARDNLAVLEKRQLHPGGDARTKMFAAPVAAGGGAEDRADARSAVSLDPVSGGKCDACGKTDTKLKACSRCKRAWYCSTDCQRSNWSVHKLVCGIKIGDRVILRNLKSKPELNGTIVKIMGEAGERWQVGLIGGDETSSMMSVSKKSVERIRQTPSSSSS